MAIVPQTVGQPQNEVIKRGKTGAWQTDWYGKTPECQDARPANPPLSVPPQIKGTGKL